MRGFPYHSNLIKLLSSNPVKVWAGRVDCGEKFSSLRADPRFPRFQLISLLKGGVEKYHGNHNMSYSLSSLNRVCIGEYIEDYYRGYYGGY